MEFLSRRDQDENIQKLINTCMCDLQYRLHRGNGFGLVQSVYGFSRTHRIYPDGSVCSGSDRSADNENGSESIEKERLE